MNTIFYDFDQKGYVLGSFIYLSVCMSAFTITPKVMNGFPEILFLGGAMTKEGSD